MAKTQEFEPRHNILSFRFWDSDDGEMCAITFTFENERPAQIALPTEVLPTFENELVESQERCKALQRAEERDTHSSVDSGPALSESNSTLGVVDDREFVHALALRVTRVSLFEQLDGLAVGIVFDHPDGAATRALLPIGYVPVFLQKVHQVQAKAQTRKGSI